MLLRFASVAGLILAASAAPALTQSPPPGSAVAEVGRTFEMLDRNRDGKLDAEEAAGSPLAARFGNVDANRDGVVVHGELMADVMQRARGGR